LADSLAGQSPYREIPIFFGLSSATTLGGKGRTINAMRLRSKEEWEQWYLKANPWNTEGTEKDRVRSQIVLERLKYARFARLLDLGCGEGGLTNTLSTISGYTLGIDISENALSRARKRYPNIEFRQG
jgi:ubiquinone/menaquinone biosynthesis C-methylase UbiE